MRAAFTVITSNYISYAKTLGDSLLKYNPNYKFYICLIGENEEHNINLGRFNIIKHTELGDNKAINSMIERYDPFELSCALKPYFAEFLLNNKKNIHRLKYFDSDIMIFNVFDKNIEEDTSTSIFLTPHFFIPVSPNESTTNDATLLKSGIYNAGYFEIANTNISRDFLNWWKERLFEYGYNFKFPFRQIFVDQSWLNLVPVYFKDTLIIDNLGYNASFYNLHERLISNVGGEYLINNSLPLVFFHFTGYLYNQHEKVSKYNSKYTYDNSPFLESLCINYRNDLIKNSIDKTFFADINSIKNKNSVSRTVVDKLNYILKKCFNLNIIRIEK